MNLKSISQKIVRYISKAKELSSKEVIVYCYTIQMLLELIISTMITLVLGIYWNNIQSVIPFLIFFAFQRIYAGGIHLKKFWQCCILSNLVIFGGVFIAENINLNYFWIIIFTIVLNLTILKCTLLKGDNYEKKYFFNKTVRNDLIIAIIIFIYMKQQQYWILYILFSSNLMVVMGCIAEKIKEMCDKKRNEWSYN